MRIGRVQEHEFRGTQDVVRHFAKIDLEPYIRDSECFYDDMACHSLDEVYFVSRPSNQVGESKRKGQLLDVQQTNESRE